MNIALIIAVGLISIIVLFAVLQWHSNKTYKPSKDEIRGIIQASIDDSISLEQFDEFSSVYIAYDNKLEEIREQYNQIIKDPSFIDADASDSNVTPLNQAGKNKLVELINALS